jgi:N-acetylneuraminate synthase/N,N'-diacetyllegionaminate synthase
MRHVTIIAEAGVNHNGDLAMAKELIASAAKAGADIVKFQTFKADSLVSKAAKKASYQSVNVNDEDDSQYNMLKKLEIPAEWYPALIDCAQEHHISFLSTGFDESSVDFLENWNPTLYKIPSGEITNKPYLQHIARKGKPVILSTGMATIDEVIQAVNVITDEGLPRDNITVLHCNTEYPTPFEDVNLLAMLHIKQKLGLRIGYSDHTLGIEVPIAAVALGAEVIEKHFTLDRNLDGPDHIASLDVNSLQEMVKAIRNIERAIAGSGLKLPSISEQKNIPIVRKSLHSRKELHTGHVIQPSDLIALRPGDGISPMSIDNIVGKKLTRDIPAHSKISLNDLV